ncbi:MAG: hypothetical protein QM762_13490 [Chryseolinea sp.]
MTVLMIFIQTLSLYALYNSSKRAELRRDAFSVWLQKPARWIAPTAGVLLLVSFILITTLKGFGAGIFLAFVSVMTTASLIVILSPLKTGRK